MESAAMVSILDQIIDNQKAEEVAKLDAVEIINNLFGELSDRERDILIRRYDLHGRERETLEKIGQAHNLTRERIRQIETASIRKLQQLKNLEDYIATFKKVIFQLLEEHGGLMERDYMLDVLTGFSLNSFKNKEEDKLIHKNYLNFLITKLLRREFEEVPRSSYFKESYKLKFAQLDHLEEVLVELLATVRKAKKIYTTEEIINLAKQLESYRRHKEKLANAGALDIAQALKTELFKEKSEVINRHKPLYSILKAARKIEQNKFGYWGFHDWPEIRPRTVNDKIYLVLKNHGEPTHFAEIANLINRIGFDNKKANAATVHNELILDDKYVLVGRGLYGLKEWGYRKGTVADVIEEILETVDKPLTRDEIIEKVLEKRIVKRATIILALMNKERFVKAEGRYSLKKK
jgi:uncharacterized membrane protein